MVVRGVLRVAAGLGCVALAMGAARGARGDVMSIVADHDNSLYEDIGGSLSNGSGNYLFAGVTLMSSRRRGLLHFDVAGALAALPDGGAGVRITGATLTMTMSRGASSASPIELRRAARAWGEGASIAPAEEGTGAPIEPGDAGWIHSVYPAVRWTEPGGDFVEDSSSFTIVTDVGVYTWGSTPRLVADMNDFLLHPETNFGYGLIGDEQSVPPTAKRFNSRENPDVASRPTLTITYAVPGPGTCAVAMAVGVWSVRRRRAGDVGCRM